MIRILTFVVIKSTEKCLWFIMVGVIMPDSDRRGGYSLLINALGKYIRYMTEAVMVQAEVRTVKKN